MMAENTKETTHINISLRKVQNTDVGPRESKDQELSISRYGI